MGAEDRPREEQLQPWSKAHAVRIIKDALQDELSAQNQYSQIIEGFRTNSGLGQYGEVVSKIAEIYQDELNHSGVLLQILSELSPNEFKITAGGMAGLEVDEAMAQETLPVEMTPEEEASKAEEAAETIQRAAEEVLNIVSHTAIEDSGDVTIGLPSPDNPPQELSDMQKERHEKMEEILKVTQGLLSSRVQRETARSSDSKYRAR